MKFRTEIPAPKYPFQISYSDSVLLMGSCFSDHIGSFFEAHRFSALSNPFGTLFNPVSIANALRLSLHPSEFNDRYCYHFNDLWVSFAHHGKFSHSDKEIMIAGITSQLKESHDFLKKAGFLFITFGTAYCYYHKESKQIVANCHKIPAAEFEKKRLEIDEIVSTYSSLVQALFDYNPGLKIVFTVSPVRHLGDGFHENQLSKSVLHLAIDQLADNERLFYFPSYEIVHDDLRDYRFYAKDLVHPDDNAVEYIQEIVSESFFSKETVNRVNEIKKENKFLGHRKLHGESKSSQEDPV